MRGRRPSAAGVMYALAQPHADPGSSLLDDTPVLLLAALALGATAAWAAAVAEILPTAVARAVGAGAAQGGLLATAVAWTADRSAGAPRLVPAGVAVAALAGAAGAAVAPLGAVAYLWAPVWLWRRRALLPGLGLAEVPCPRLVLAGAALGTLLALHLAATASLTLGYRMGRPAPVELVPWLAYDLGANVLAAECLFRGALFDRMHRRWSFGAAAALSTGACVARYLADPLLPRTLEVTAGAAFYIALLGIGNCWLYRRTRSVVPGLIAGLIFFAVYRLLHQVG